jgi:cell wall assembly regulator SMI1
MPSPPWHRIDAWLAQHAPKVLRLLRPPIEDASLAKLEAAAGRPLPRSLVEAYRAHDGAAGEHATILGAVRAPNEALWVRHASWFSADRAVGSLLFMRDLPQAWPAALLPIADDTEGNLVVVDLDSGQVSAWNHEDRSSARLADDLGAWLTHLAADMDARLVVAGSVEEQADDTLALLDAPPAPPPPAPIIARDRAARVFVEMLVEKRSVALLKGADLEPLIAALTDALAITSAAARKQTVIGLLEDSRAVEEIFADDEVLGTLVDDLA